MSPRRLVVKCGDDCYAVQVFWDPDEWCSELPDWWVEIAGCSRCVRVTLLATLAHHGHETAHAIIDHLYQQGFHIADNGRWVVVLEDERACIAPWPKHVHTTLTRVKHARAAQHRKRKNTAQTQRTTRPRAGEKMSLTLTQPKPHEQVAIIADTDMHGGLSLAASWMALRKAGIEPVVAYSNFQLVKPGETPSQPVTNAQWLADSLPQIVSPANFRGTIYILDIPMNNLAPQKHAEALRQYTAAGSKVVVVNKAGHDPEIAPKLYADAGIDYIPVDTDIAVALFIPRKYGVVDNDIYRIAKWAALADFDPSIEREVSYEEEELVTEWVDQYWKFESKQDPAIPSEYRVRHGNVGALARMIVENGLEWLERRAREVAKPIPTPQYEVKGDVVVVYGPEIPGMAWKLAAKACRLSGAKVAVAKAVSPRGQAVIIATNWRWKARLPQLVEIVDRVANEIAAGRSVVGNPGARSVLARSPEDADMLIQQAVEKLNEYISSYAYTPRTAHLISERHVAEAVIEDYRMLYRLLERIARALERGASAKEKQVSLLEKLYREQPQSEVRAD